MNDEKQAKSYATAGDVTKMIERIKKVLDTPEWEEFQEYLGVRIRDLFREAAHVATSDDALRVCAAIRATYQMLEEFQGRLPALERYLDLMKLKEEDMVRLAHREQVAKQRPMPYIGGGPEQQEG